MTMAYLMLYGNGWTQRWRIVDGEEDRVRDEITRIGKDGTGQLSVIDSRTDARASLVVSWAAVAAAVVLDADSDPEHETATGQYA
jgi:hypothetical protein